MLVVGPIIIVGAELRSIKTVRGSRLFSSVMFSGIVVQVDEEVKRRKQFLAH